MGGKRRLADRLIPLFPPHECYVEVFAGGAALFFMRPQPAPVEVLNDLNGDLVTLYRVVQNHLEEFVRQFKWALSSRQIFEWQKMTRPETLTDIQRAARFFYLQQHAFGGKVTGQTFGTATTGPAINLLRIEENLSSAWQRLAGTYVENLLGTCVLSAMIEPTRSFTWIHHIGKPQGMEPIFRLRSMSIWRTSCGAARGRLW
jgi:DNA adenine methylase